MFIVILIAIIVIMGVYIKFISNYEKNKDHVLSKLKIESCDKNGSIDRKKLAEKVYNEILKGWSP